MRDLLIVCPHIRDLKAIGEAGLGSRYRIHVVGKDLDSVESFDVEAIVEECLEGPADGVIGTKDRSALIAALVAARRGLPGPTIRALANCQHKPTSRTIQSTVAPESTPRFSLLESRLSLDPPLVPPLFAKPVIGRLSQYAARVETESDLEHLPELDGYSHAWDGIVQLGGLRIEPVDGFLVEELLGGVEVTFEGYVFQGAMTTIGVTDSQKYEGTPSFERFEYPSSLPDARLDELDDVAARVIGALGFDNGFFNMEFYVPDEGPVQIIEANGRIASQFAPLVEALHGRSTYDALFALACGDDPAWASVRPDGVAMSYCLRVFDDAFVEEVPEPEEGLEVLVRPGKRLSEQGTNDPQSFRLAIFSESGSDRAAVLERCRARARALPFKLSAI